MYWLHISQAKSPAFYGFIPALFPTQALVGDQTILTSFNFICRACFYNIFGALPFGTELESQLDLDIVVCEICFIGVK
jgi:hypothetical protein